MALYQATQTFHNCDLQRTFWADRIYDIPLGMMSDCVEAIKNGWLIPARAYPQKLKPQPEPPTLWQHIMSDDD